MSVRAMASASSRGCRSRLRPAFTSATMAQASRAMRAGVSPSISIARASRAGTLSTDEPGRCLKILARLQIELEGAGVGDRAFSEPPVLVRGEADVESTSRSPSRPAPEPRRHPPWSADTSRSRGGHPIWASMSWAVMRRSNCRFAHSPFQDIAHTQLPTDRLHILLRAPELHRRSSRDDPQRADTSKGRR